MKANTTVSSWAKDNGGRAWRDTPVTPALKRLRQEAWATETLFLKGEIRRSIAWYSAVSCDPSSKKLS